MEKTLNFVTWGTQCEVRRASMKQKRNMTPAPPPPKKRKTASRKKSEAHLAREVIRQYGHGNTTRPNNPPVGLVDPNTDQDLPAETYKYEPHLDPMLVWAGKNEKTKCVVDTVSLHQHERIDPFTIIDKVLKPETQIQEKITLHFEQTKNNLPLRNALQFYQHSHNWSNRLIAGDSLLVMNSLLKKEDFAGKIQTIYIDPPYGIEYKSNFQPFVNNTKVKDRNYDDLNKEPEMVKAYRDTWELEIHSYLNYLRDRLLLARELLHETGSCGVQISDENLHYVRIIMDEVFGSENFVSIISFRKTSSTTSTHIPVVFDYIVWYAKNKKVLKSNKLYIKKDLPINDPNYKYLELASGERIKMSKAQRENPLTIPPSAKIFRLSDMRSQGESSGDDEIEFEGEIYTPGKDRHWSVPVDGMRRLDKKNRLRKQGNTLAYVRYFDDSDYTEIQNLWDDTSTGGFEPKIYVVHTTPKVIRRFLLMTSDPGDIVLDPTCGSGTTAVVAEEFGRRWITCDTSRVAITLAKKRIMTSTYKYYELKHPTRGISSGFIYKKFHRVTPKLIANNEDPIAIELYDHPKEDKTKARVSGPFTVEAVPSATANSIDTMYAEESNNNQNDENIRQQAWREELQKTGIIGKNNRKLEFLSVEPHPATKWIHAKAQTNEPHPKNVMFSFGTAYAPLEQRQVENAIQEIRKLGEKPEMLIFAALQFDPEAAKDIDELKWPGFMILKAQMNSDLLTADLKSKEPSNESFMFIGQPDVKLEKTKTKNKYKVTIRGFDYYNVIKNKIESHNTSKIAMWMLDTDYDGRSVYPQQVFFPMKDLQGGWSKIEKQLKHYIDLNLIKYYVGTESIEFAFGKNEKIAVKIIDDRGIETLKILERE